jgi:hypothetical protein
MSINHEFASACKNKFKTTQYFKDIFFANFSVHFTTGNVDVYVISIITSILILNTKNTMNKSILKSILVVLQSLSSLFL